MNNCLVLKRFAGEDMEWILLKKIDHYSAEKQGGSGLSLAIFQAIINKYNGNIFVESSQGVGSSFTIYLLATEEVQIVKTESPVEDRIIHRIKILIIDDEEVVREQ